ncbi:MAG: hypothetical protein PVI72_10180 [Desulfobacterales bacterium]|jgi:hypothetical protein
MMSGVPHSSSLSGVTSIAYLHFDDDVDFLHAKNIEQHDNGLTGIPR